MSGDDLFPKLRSCTRLAMDNTIFDVKFYPYSTTDDEQIFATTGGTDTVVYRMSLGTDPPYQILRWFREEEVDAEDGNAALNSLAWTKNPVTKKPWLCVAGHGSSSHRAIKTIKILDIESGGVVRALPGHGGGINDLVISPLSTSILASASEDCTIRMWNLHPKYEQQPCVALLAGEGHRSPVLAITFHPNGKWLLSGGIDTAVCLWAVPGPSDLNRENGTAQGIEPLSVYYPHFFTEELHPNYVDALVWYGDLIISRAARDPKGTGANKKGANEILLWKIEGFDSDHPPPAEPPIPVSGQQTRSSFAHDLQYRGFWRVLTLSIPETDRFFHRFGFFHAAGMRPILCMGNQESRFLFWDLQRLEEGEQRGSKLGKPRNNRGRSKKTGSYHRDMRRSESLVEPSRSVQSRDGSSISGEREERELTLDDRFRPLPPHHAFTPSTKPLIKQYYATSQIAWSSDGTWMVAVGDHGMMLIFHRDKIVVR